jgi:hypothetical protein
MKLALIFLIATLIYAADSTKVKPTFRYKKMKMEVDSLDLKTTAIKEKLDSLNQRKQEQSLHKINYKPHSIMYDKIFHNKPKGSYVLNRSIHNSHL